MPLIVNLLLAAIVRAAVPYTLAEGGERYRYYFMHSFVPIQGCAAFHCYRFLPPMLASLLPLGTVDSFLVTGFLFEVAAGTLLWMIAERLHGSRKVAFLTTLLFWLTWGPLHSFSDPLLISDPVQACWSFAALYLLLTERYAAALPLLVIGATVKESVLLVPAIYAAYAWFTLPRSIWRSAWLASLVVVPAAAWLMIRIALAHSFGYQRSDSAYIQNVYLLGGWLPSLGPFPGNLLTASGYVYGVFGAAWVLAVLGWRRANARQRVLTLASIPAMMFLSVQQSPDRALACFPYAVLIPAALALQDVPLAAAAALLASNVALVIAVRRTAVWWLPRAPVVAAAFVVLVTVCAMVLRRRHAAPPGVGEADAAPRRAAARAGERWIVAASYGAAAALVLLIVSRGASARELTTIASSDAAPSIVADDGGTPGLAVSPDGARVVFVGETAAGRDLWLRVLEGGETRRLEGTAGASEPFWSAAGGGVGFFAAGWLKTIAPESGVVTTLAPAPSPCGGAWGRGDVIVFAPRCGGGLSAVPARGGSAKTVTTPDPAAGQTAHAWPSFLPDGDHFLFLSHGQSAETTHLSIGSVADGSFAPVRDLRSTPDHAVFNAQYVAPGFLLFARPDGVWVQPFDLRRMAVIAQRQQFTVAVAQNSNGRGAFAVGGGTIVFAVRADPKGSATAPAFQLLWGRWRGMLIDRTL